MKRHKHYDCIVAWAEGKSIQTKTSDGQWVDILSSCVPAWEVTCEYRVKPEEIVKYLTVYYDDMAGICVDRGFENKHNLKVVVNGIDHSIISIEGKI
jgi:hypothetical protein